MKKFILTLALLLPVVAEAQCTRISSGYFEVRRRQSLFCGGNFCMRLACTRWVPFEPYWHGGRICVGSRMFGRIGLYGPLWSCRVLGFTGKWNSRDSR